jgi:recombination protein RecA
MLPAIPFGWRDAAPVELLRTGMYNFPRGRISEIIGPPSSGRTSLLHSILAASTRLGEFAVMIDTHNAFDPATAAAAGADLSKLIWIRCSGNAEHALRAADLVIHSGGFGTIALDLAEAPDPALHRIPATAWFRFRRAIQATPAVVAVIAQRPVAKSCSALIVEMQRGRAKFTGKLLREVDYELSPRKPAGKERIALHCAAV